MRIVAALLLTGRTIQFGLLTVLGAFVLAPNLAFSEDQPTITLDLTEWDFAEQRIGNIVQINGAVDRLIDNCKEISPFFVPADNVSALIAYQNVCIANRIVGAQENFLDSTAVQVLVEGSGMLEIGLALAGVPNTGPALALSLNVRRNQRLWGENVPREHRFDGSFREIVVDPPESHRWAVNIEWLGGLTNPVSDEIAILNDAAGDLREYDSESEMFEAYEEIIAAYERLGPEVEPFRHYADTDYKSIELVVVARRIDGDCAMSATVSGDINRHVFGDSAYFNIAQVPVKKGMMVGTIGETQTHEQVAGFGTVGGPESVDDALDLAASFGLIGEEERAEAQASVDRAMGDSQNQSGRGGSDRGSEDFAEWAQRELRADNPSEGDNFGLNLVDIKSDVTPKDDALAGAMLGGAFTFTLSGRADLSEFTDREGRERENPRINVIPSTVTATVGVSDKGGDRIPFELPEDGSLVGNIEFQDVNSDYIFGQLIVDLETKGVYTLEGVADSPRKLNAQVFATFAARRGSLSCMH